MQRDWADEGAGGAAAFVFASRPNASLSDAQRRLAFWAIALPCLGIAVYFSAIGYWLLLPFSGLEVGVLAWAFERLRLTAGDFETLSLDGDRVVLTWRAAGVNGRCEFNRQWVSVECACRQGGRDCRLGLRSRGTTVAFGRHLGDEDRCRLARRLRERLGR